MPAGARIALLATGAALAIAAPASAAYAPQFSFRLDPSTANTPATISSTVTQAAGETPTKTATITLPSGFTPNPTNALATCTAAQELTIACPAESQMGSLTAAVLGLNLSGPVYFGGVTGTAFRLIGVLDPTGLQQKIIGVSSLKPDGTITTVFDNLPPILATAFTLVLDGGNKALIKTPSKCGSAPVNAAFVSQTGETSSTSTPIDITGCSASAPSTTAPGATPKPSAPGSATKPTAPLRVGAGKLARSGLVTFSLSAPARVTVTVTRAGKRVGRRTVSGKKGVNRVRLGKKVKSGRYKVSLSAVDAAGRTVRKNSNVRLR
jgi:hypothetical protein